MEAPLVPPLKTLIFHVTTSCNLHCRHCWQSPDRKVGFPESPDPATGISPTRFHEVVREAKALGLRNVKFTGGEPFLHPRFMDYLEIAGREDLEVIIETNGTLLEPNHLSVLKSIRLTQLAVSLDGAHSTTHDRLRGVEGAHARTLSALEMLAGLHLPLQLIMCLYRENIQEMDELLRLADHYGVQSVKLNPIQPMGQGEDLAERGESLSLFELLDLDAYCRKAVSNGFSGSLQFHLPLVFRSIREIRGQQYSNCRILSILGLLPDGDLSFCGIGQTNRELIIGNIHRDRLADLWPKARLLRELRQGLPGELKGACARCLLKTICMGECRAVAYARTGDIRGPYWICQQAMEQGLFPAGRLLPGEPMGFDMKLKKG